MMAAAITVGAVWLTTSILIEVLRRMHDRVLDRRQQIAERAHDRFRRWKQTLSVHDREQLEAMLRDFDAAYADSFAHVGHDSARQREAQAKRVDAEKAVRAFIAARGWRRPAA